MFKYISLAALILFSFSCSEKNPRDEKATQIVAQSIQKHGGKNYQNLDVSFDFRQFRVHLKHKEGAFLYERTTRDSANNLLHDILTNDYFRREMNGKKLELSQKEYDKYQEGLNAMAYFALLPYKLSEPAVILKYLGEATIENKKYHKIGVSFKADKGGKDHQDEFCYWISKNDHSMDYLSYASGGPRFRKAIKREKVAGITFQNYENYVVADSTLAPSNYDNAFKAGKVKLLSLIEQQNYTSP